MTGNYPPLSYLSQKTDGSDRDFVLRHGYLQEAHRRPGPVQRALPPREVSQTDGARVEGLQDLLRPPVVLLQPPRHEDEERGGGGGQEPPLHGAQDVSPPLLDWGPNSMVGCSIFKESIQLAT